MQLRPRFLGRLGLADCVSVLNVGIGFVAIILAAVDPRLAARAILVAAMADGLDGLLARRYGSTPVGEYVDSLADIVSFGVAPAVLVVASVSSTTARAGTLGFAGPLVAVVGIGIPAVFVATGVLRLAMYTAYDIEERVTKGVQTTLAATVLAAATLAVEVPPIALLGGCGVFAYLMITEIPYPDLRTRDALTMGIVQGGAVLLPAVGMRVFPRALFAFSLAYLVLAPFVYPRIEKSGL